MPDKIGGFVGLNHVILYNSFCPLLLPSPPTAVFHFSIVRFPILRLLRYTKKLRSNTQSMTLNLSSLNRRSGLFAEHNNFEAPLPLPCGLLPAASSVPFQAKKGSVKEGSIKVLLRFYQGSFQVACLLPLPPACLRRLHKACLRFYAPLPRPLPCIAMARAP